MNEIDNIVKSIAFNGVDFTNFISFVKAMSTKCKQKGSTNVQLHIEDNRLVCRAVSDDLSNGIEYYVDLYDNDNGNEIILEPLVVSITDLAALIKCAYSDKFIIRKYHNQYEFNIIGNGWLSLKVVESNGNKFTIDGDCNDVGIVNSVKLRNAISSVLGYTQDFTYPRDRYLQFTDTSMTVTSRLSSVVIKDDFVNMVLHRDDAGLLKLLLKDNFDLCVKRITSDVERLLFMGNKFKFIIAASDIQRNDASYLADINDYIKVNCAELYKLVSLSEEYPASKHVVGITIKNGELSIGIKNVLSSRHRSTVSSTMIGNIPDMKLEAEVSTHNLLKALKLFQDKHSRDININLSDEMLTGQNCIIFFDSNTQAIVNIYNR